MDSTSASSFLPTPDDALETLKHWQDKSSTADDTIELLKAVIKCVDDPNGVAAFKASFENLATGEPKIRARFSSIQRLLEKFIQEHGRDFPKVAEYKEKWAGLQSRWEGLVKIIRDVVHETSQSYQEYDEAILAKVEKIQTESDKQDAIRSLKTFSEKELTNVPEDFLQQVIFFILIQGQFYAEFHQYLDQNGVTISEKVKAVTEDIRTLIAEISQINTDLRNALSDLTLAKWWEVAADALRGSDAKIDELTAHRAGKLKDLEAREKTLADLNGLQDGLAKAVTSMDGLYPETLLEFRGLVILADIWSQFHTEARWFSQILIASPGVDFPEHFKLRVQLARKIAAPLEQGLNML